MQSDCHFAAVMLAPAPNNRAALGSDKLEAYNAPAGAIVVHPASVDGRAEWSCTRESIIIALRPESLTELAAAEFDMGGVSLQPPAFGTVDFEALRIAERLKAELTRAQPPNELYIDSLVTIFGVHLLRNYAAGREPVQRMKGGLSVRSAEAVRDFLEENFTRKLQVAELAAVCGLSPLHFIRAFTRTFGKPPHQYLIRRRLAFAEELLRRGEFTIAEVAYLSGFSNQSHLTSAMSKYLSVTPKQLRTLQK
ncbi:AraC family transcriptional regulator [Nitratireductor sp. ZSWI3]|uniref:AraC family transcriptional regulator n=1 Tax=Nitratireductor sp. ZSWI3 TaxID=2966359 RepID=UPI0021500D75|nr:AraC family transcriptional regulator [Nitratireductor sp. ZSWI3]MCR4265851.1 AraC family transcriptional regulator [Nitratireductor sp. ZSWI3]